jgi:hypothetical protein
VAELVEPSTTRLATVMAGVCTGSFSLYYFVGVCGYCATHPPSPVPPLARPPHPSSLRGAHEKGEQLLAGASCPAGAVLIMVRTLTWLRFPYVLENWHA